MRIVSLSPSVTDVLVSLGASDEVVGVSVYCRRYAPSHAEVIGDYQSVKLERLKELSPTIVFTSGEAQKRLASMLSSHGFRVVNIPVPSSIYEIAGMIWRVGVTVGRVHEALEASEKIMERLSSFRGSLPPQRLAYIIDLGEPVAPGALSYAGHALSYLGVRHVYDSVPRDWIRVMPADVRRYAPQLIIVEARSEKPTVEQGVGFLRRWLILDERLAKRIEVRVVPRDTLAHYGPQIINHLKLLVEVVGGGKGSG